MPKAIIVVAAVPIVSELRAQLAAQPGVEMDEIEPWNSPVHALDAPFNPAWTEIGRSMLTVLAEDDLALKSIATALADCRSDLVLMDAANGAGLGQVASGADAEEFHRVLALASDLD